MASALKSSLKDMDKRERYINLLNDRVIDKLSKLDGIKINKTKYSIPHILSLSVENANIIANDLSKKEIYVTTNLSTEISPAVMAIYNDLKRSKETIRISISHLTTVLEINKFLEEFMIEYNKINI